jgi:hypothetical protein
MEVFVKTITTINRFDELSDDAVVPRRVTAAVLGTSKPLRLSLRLSGNRVGATHAIARRAVDYRFLWHGTVAPKRSSRRRGTA